MQARKILLLFFWVLILSACTLPFSIDMARPEAQEEAETAQNTESPIPGQAVETPVPTETPASPPPATATATGAAAATATLDINSPQTANSLQSPLPDQAAGFIRYALQPGTPLGIENFIHPEAACNWLGVGGQVFSLKAEPVTGLVVELGGTLDGSDISQLAITGGATVFGPAGFEFTLGDQPVASNGALWLQVISLNGTPLSDKVYFDTYSDCSRNLVLLNFTEIKRFQVTQYLPWVGYAEFIFYFPNMYKNQTIRYP